MNHSRGTLRAPQIASQRIDFGPRSTRALQQWLEAAAIPGAIREPVPAGLSLACPARGRPESGCRSPPRLLERPIPEIGAARTAETSRRDAGRPRYDREAAIAADRRRHSPGQFWSQGRRRTGLPVSLVAVELLAQDRKLALKRLDLGLVDARVDSWARRLPSGGCDGLLELLGFGLCALVLVFVADRHGFWSVSATCVVRPNLAGAASSTALRIRLLTVTPSASASFFARSIVARGKRTGTCCARG